jgi:hypothetical protein
MIRMSWCSTQDIKEANIRPHIMHSSLSNANSNMPLSANP